MKRKFKHTQHTLLMILLLLLTACIRGEDEPIAGIGGNATLKITPMHHNKTIDSCTLYIKYNASDKPSTYDDSAKVVLINGLPVATFTSLKKGKYYLFGRGCDNTIFEIVEGGIPYTINNENIISLNLPVTEAGH